MDGGNAWLIGAAYFTGTQKKAADLAACRAGMQRPLSHGRKPGGERRRVELVTGS